MPMKDLVLSSQPLTLAEIEEVLLEGCPVAIAAAVRSGDFDAWSGEQEPGVDGYRCGAWSNASRRAKNAGAGL